MRNNHYEEIFAKIVLENVFEDRGYQFEQEDAPDLVDAKQRVGVEVVQAMYQKIHEYMEFNVKLKRKPLDEWTKRDIKQLKKLRTEAGIGENWLWKPISFSSDELTHKHPITITYNSINRKLRKLHSYHENFSGKYGGYERYEINLCVIVENGGNINPIEEDVFQKYKELQEDYLIKFNHIFLICHDEVVDFNFDENTYGSYFVDHNLLSDWYELSYKIANKEASYSDIARNWKSKNICISVSVNRNSRGNIRVGKIREVTNGTYYILKLDDILNGIQNKEYLNSWCDSERTIVL